jgi:hypothetical protein
MKSAHPHQGMLSAVDVYAVVGRAIDVQISVRSRRPCLSIIQKDHSYIMRSAAPVTLYQKVI